MDENKRNKQNSDFRKNWQTKRLLGIKYLGGLCCECGNDNEIVLQFDHIATTNITCGTPKLSITELYSELDKCELVCANCHKIRTKSREQHRNKNAYRTLWHTIDSYKRHSRKRVPKVSNLIKTHQFRDGICKKGHLNPPIDKHGRCLLCCNEWTRNYYKTGTKRYELKKNRKNKSRQAMRLRAIEYLGGKCCDCGIDDKRVFEFDHIIPGPLIPRCMDFSWERLKIELDKCELVCANCHCIRTRLRNK
ncbi:MAG: hypothetical protein M0R50_11275 [Candidatus Cloacimonetes bacterium]|jgi:hypothetical protein|nr:hypothetical protein [Candidatus Cloacimonadota bacterium]